MSKTKKTPKLSLSLNSTSPNNIVSVSKKSPRSPVAESPKKRVAPAAKRLSPNGLTISTSTIQAVIPQLPSAMPIEGMMDILPQDGEMAYRRSETPVSVTSTSESDVSTKSEHHDNDGSNPYENGPLMILPYLYLGSEKNASSMDILKKHGIECIVNVGVECKRHFDIANSNPTSPNDCPLSPLYNPLNMVRRRTRRLSNIQSMPSSPLAKGPHSPYTHLNDRDRQRSQPTLPQHSQSADSSPQFFTLDTSTTESSPQREEMSELNNRLEELKSSSPVLQALESSQGSTIPNSYGRDNSNRPASPAAQSPCTPAFFPTYHHLPWTHNQEDIVSSLPDAVEFIEKARNEKKGVLVHCKQGLSRSATMMIAYLMKSQHITMSEAYAKVKAKSDSISPNLVLVFQLMEYERNLGLQPQQESS